MTTTKSGVFGALWVDGVEVLDGGYRMANYMALGACGATVGCSGAYVNAAEFKNPRSPVSPYSTISIGTDPTAAPWYDSAAPHSSEFLGFYTDTVDGWREMPSTRQQFSRGGYPGGGVVGGARNAVREITIQVTAKACTCEGLTYGMSWLDEMLLGSTRMCGDSEIVMRDCDPDDANPSRGLWTVYQAGLSTSPVWTTSEGDCTMAEATFTVTAGDPCLYGPITSVTTGTIFQADCADPAGICAVLMGPAPASSKVCGNIPASAGTIGMNGAVVEIRNETSRESGAWIVSTIPNPLSTACTSMYGTAPTSRVVVKSLPPGTEMQIDVLRRQILSRPIGGDWVSSGGLLDLSSGDAPVWTVTKGTPQTIVVEPLRPWCVPAAGVGVSIGWRHKERCVG